MTSMDTPEELSDEQCRDIIEQHCARHPVTATQRSYWQIIAGYEAGYRRASERVAPLVPPRKPTPEMLEAGACVLHGRIASGSWSDVGAVYSAMYDAGVQQDGGRNDDDRGRRGGGPSERLPIIGSAVAGGRCQLARGLEQPQSAV